MHNYKAATTTANTVCNIQQLLQQLIGNIYQLYNSPHFSQSKVIIAKLAQEVQAGFYISIYIAFV